MQEIVKYYAVLLIAAVIAGFATAIMRQVLYRM